MTVVGPSGVSVGASGSLNVSWVRDRTLSLVNALPSVVLHGLLTDEQPLGDDPVKVPGRSQLRDGEFPAGQ
jgi:hypothetical protein